MIDLINSLIVFICLLKYWHMLSFKEKLPFIYTCTYYNLIWFRKVRKTLRQGFKLCPKVKRKISKYGLRNRLFFLNFVFQKYKYILYLDPILTYYHNQIFTHYLEFQSCYVPGLVQIDPVVLFKNNLKISSTMYF